MATALSEMRLSSLWSGAQEAFARQKLRGDRSRLFGTPTFSRVAACSPDAFFTLGREASQLLGQGMGRGRCFLGGLPFRLRVEAPAASGATKGWALATGTMPPSVATFHSLKYPEVSQWPGSDAFGPLFLA